MKVYRMSFGGVSTHPTLQVETTPEGRQYAYFAHGERGRGRWEWRLPLHAGDFPVEGKYDPRLKSYREQDFALCTLEGTDQRGNPRCYLRRWDYTGRTGHPLPDQLIFLSLDPGYRGGATWSTQVICDYADFWVKHLASGYEAQGEAGRMGGAECPVLLMEYSTLPTVIRWERTGRLYGSPAKWEARWSPESKSWTVAPEGVTEMEDALFA